MPYRTTPFANDEYYHIFNRGVAKMSIYNNTSDYKRFLRTMNYYLIAGKKPRFSLFSPLTTLLNPNDKIINIICYCLMPNHFHLLLKQNKDGGISEFMRKLGNSYTKYANTKYNRVGPLLQGQFKAVHIETNEQLLHVSRYIHLNPVVGYVVENLEDYAWSSYREYIYNQQNICEKEIILQQLKQKDWYKYFVLDQEDYARSLNYIKHQLLDGEN